MKAEITTKEKAFEPIKVNITIESLEELNDLCARLDIHYSDVNKYITGKYNELVSEDASYGLWGKLDTIYESLK